MTSTQLGPMLREVFVNATGSLTEKWEATAFAAIESLKPTATPATADGDTSSDHVVLALIAAMERNYSAQTSAGDRERNVWTQALIESAAREVTTAEAIHPTCREFAYGVGHDQAKTMGVPLTDEPFYAWLKRRDAALAADAEKWGKP